MDKLYQLVFPNQSSPFLGTDDGGEIEGISLISHDIRDDNVLVCLRHGDKLTVFKYNTHGAPTWERYCQATVFSGGNGGHYPIALYPWLVTHILENEEGAGVILRNSDGIRFYQLRTSSSGPTCDLPLLARDSRFQDVFGWAEPSQNRGSLLWGHFFPDTQLLGVMAHDGGRNVSQFYVVKPERVLKGLVHPMWEMKKKLSLPPGWNSPNNQVFMVRQATPSGQDLIGLRTERRGLELYTFDEKYSLKCVAAYTGKFTSEDHFYFGDLIDPPPTNSSSFKDILHLNATGLHLLQYDRAEEAYVLIHRETEAFSKSNGWLPTYTSSIQLGDLNNDGRDDLIFTGPRGMSALIFDDGRKEWRSLLKTGGLTRARRYGEVVATLAPMPPMITSPSVFIRGRDGKLEWAMIEAVDTPSTSTSAPTSTPATETTHLPLQVGNHQIPGEIRRQFPSQPATLLWAEQYDSGFLQNVVNPSNGQVELNVPLLDLRPLTGWGVQISLSYSSQEGGTESLGLGWFLGGLPEDHIFVDYRGSIFPPDYAYYLVTAGGSQKLKYVQSLDSVQHFELDGNAKDEAIQIKYYQSDQRWLIEGPIEQVSFGKDRDALRWTLGWPNWRGSGSDKTSLEPVITSWYVNSRIDKVNKRRLHYSYDNEEESVTRGHNHTSAVRLNKVVDLEGMEIVFNYARKSEDASPPIIPGNDNNLNFPLPLANSHYLTGYRLTTAPFKQEIQFTYQVTSQGTRLLTGMEQHLFSGREPLLQFSYESSQGHHRMTGCHFRPQMLTVNFTCQEVTGSSPRPILRHPIRSESKLAYGQDYAVLSYGTLNEDQIILKLLNRQMTNITKELYCTFNSKLKDYSVHTFPNSILVVIQADSGGSLNIFKRDNDGSWGMTPTIHSIDEDALIRISESGIVAVSGPHQNHVKLWDVTKPETETILPLPPPARKLTRLVIQNSFMVGYDSAKLHIFQRDPRDPSHWWRKTLDAYPSSVEDILSRFDLTPEMKHRLSTSMEQSGLQIFNNVVALTTLRKGDAEHDHRLSFNLHLYLLDPELTVANHEQFHLCRRDILQEERLNPQDGTNFTLGYFQENGLYKLKLRAMAGKMVDEIKHQNKLTEQVEIDNMVGKVLSSLGEDEGFQKDMKNTFIVELDNCAAHLGEGGVRLGSNNELLQFTGVGWDKIGSKKSEWRLPLGNQLVLESPNNNAILELYKQTSDGERVGPPLETINMDPPGQIVNKYPAYIAYQSGGDLVKVLSFKDGGTIGPTLEFQGEQLMTMVSDYQNLVTVSNSSEGGGMFPGEEVDLVVRPILAMLPAGPQLFMNEMKVAVQGMERITGYMRSFTDQDDNQGQAVTETVEIIPTGNRNVSGWFETRRIYGLPNATDTIIEAWYNRDGEEVKQGENSKEDPKPNNEEETAPPPNLLLDQSNTWVISDFSPYHLEDEMLAYYGFESYEKNQIGGGSKSWRVNKGDVINGGFAFTGENYLKLSNSTATDPAYFEGEFVPRVQHNSIVYLASCWIRNLGDDQPPLEINQPVSYLQGTVRSVGDAGREIFSLDSQVKILLRDWSYLELRIDFQEVKQVYQEYFRQNANNVGLGFDNPEDDDLRFKIILRVVPPPNQTLDLDHIRFSPLSHDFEARIFSTKIGKPTSVLQANGLVRRTFYNGVGTEIARMDEAGQIEKLTSSTLLGKLVPPPRARRGSLLQENKPMLLQLEPEMGYYENFDPYSLALHWILEDPPAWRIAQGQLWHKHPGNHRIEAGRPDMFIPESNAVRCNFALEGDSSTLTFRWPTIGSFELTRQSNDLATLVFPNDLEGTTIPAQGELIIMSEEDRVWLWLNGVLLLDKKFPAPSTKSNFSVDMKGLVLIGDCFFMGRPKLRLEYNNGFGDLSQELDLEDSNTVLITETLYDVMGREAISTKKSRVTATASEALLIYRENFVRNKNPSDFQSVWRTGKITGEVNDLNPSDQGVPFSRVEFFANPLNEKCEMGLAGPDFSVGGAFAIRYGSSSEVHFLSLLFPRYRQEVEYAPGGSFKIGIFDEKNNLLAKYVHVPSYEDLLSTYEYDEGSRLVKILPPAYHERMDTAGRLTPWRSEEAHLTPEENHAQEELATFYNYDEFGHLIRKKTPDTGVTRYLYNRWGKMRFLIQSQNVVYFDYDVNSQMIRSGLLQSIPSSSVLLENLNNGSLQNSQDYHILDHGDSHPDPVLRGRVKHIVTHNADGIVVLDGVTYGGAEKIVEKSGVIAFSDPESNHTSKSHLGTIHKQYRNGRTRTLTYPIILGGEELTLIHSYNRQGKLTSLGTDGEPNRFGKFTYHASGHLASEEYQSRDDGGGGGYTRHFRYNSPGFLEEISDPFLTETILYTETGYGHGDGMVMLTSFNASWPKDADPGWFRVKEDSPSNLEDDYMKVCMNGLRRRGYLTGNNRVLKSFVRKLETGLPGFCGGDREKNLARLVGQKKAPFYYGHRYAYDGHRSLVNAKYFTDDTASIVEPLMADSFSRNIKGVSRPMSNHIWGLLKRGHYIVTDNRGADEGGWIGKEGKSIWRDMDLHQDLAKLNANFIIYSGSIRDYIGEYTSSRGCIPSGEEFTTKFLHWTGFADRDIEDGVITQGRRDAQEIFNMLTQRGYFTIENAVDRDLLKMLHGYREFLPEIVGVLRHHFAYALGESPFDVESFHIDANGNHRHFYRGFDRFELTYRNGSNQVESVKVGQDKNFEMRHDPEGNVIQAMHKGIHHIQYDPVSQRTTRIELVDGRSLTFVYDAHGERVLKRVLGRGGGLLKEIYYLRDELGRVIMDKEVTHDLGGEGGTVVTTAYIYGPRGLLGFLRGDNFYTVMTDHLGSVRLVIREGEGVIVAYDYMPYGQLMREFGSTTGGAGLRYRYTGQEWDEETGLYNYHARLYDPDIGRFYQVDPKSQYFSPYKYAGNSPVSLVDPDGEEAILWIAMGICALIGAYLAGSAANDNWMPFGSEGWDWTEGKTYLGIIGGGIGGALLPLAFTAGPVVSAVAVGTGLGLGYLNTAANNQEWAPWKWDLTRPGTYNAFFVGFSVGANIPGGIVNLHQFAGKATGAVASISKFLHISATTGKNIFIGVSYASGVGMAYAYGARANEGEVAFWRWNWEDPNTYSSLVFGFDVGKGWPQGFLEVGRGVYKLQSNFHFKDLAKLLDKESWKWGTDVFKDILKNPQHPMYKVAGALVMGYFKGSDANGKWSGWDMSQFSTYEAILNGIFSGKDMAHTLVKAAKKSQKAPPDAASAQPPDIGGSDGGGPKDAYAILTALSGSSKVPEVAPPGTPISNNNNLPGKGRPQSAPQPVIPGFEGVVTPRRGYQSQPPPPKSVWADVHVTYVFPVVPPDADSSHHRHPDSDGDSPVENFPSNSDPSDSESIVILPNVQETSMSSRSKRSASHMSKIESASSGEWQPRSTSTGGGLQWLGKLDVNGLLLLGIVLARKWTGLNDTESNGPVIESEMGRSVELDIMSAELVNQFMDYVLDQAYLYGIGQTISKLLENPKSYSKAMKIVRRKLTAGELDTIPEALHQTFIEGNKLAIAINITGTPATDYFAGGEKSLAELREKFLQLEQEWQARKQIQPGATTGYPHRLYSGNRSQEGNTFFKLEQILMN